MKRTRLPLQIGISCLHRLALGLFLVSSATALGLLVALIGARRVAVAIEPASRAPVVFWSALLALAAAALGAVQLRAAYRLRPSDILIDDDAFEIDGGPRHGLRVAWADVRAAASHLGLVFSNRFAFLQGAPTGADVGALDRGVFRLGKQVERVELRVLGRGGEALALASCERPIELASLRALLDVIHAHGALPAEQGSPADAPRYQELNLDVLLCAACGAPQAPIEAPTTLCRHCGATVVIPTAVLDLLQRSRLAALESLRSEALMSRLIRQPGARRIAALLVLAAITMTLVAPSVVAVFFVRTARLAAVDVVALLVLLFAVLGGLFALFRAQLVDRFALCAVTLGFSAKRPSEPGAAPCCRACDAPLFAPPPRVVARCIYCSADNVLSTDLGATVRAIRGAADTLAATLERRTKERALWRLAMLPAAFSLVGGGLGLRGFASGYTAEVDVLKPPHFGAMARAIYDRPLFATTSLVGAVSKVALEPKMLFGPKATGVVDDIEIGRNDLGSPAISPDGALLMVDSSSPDFWLAKRDRKRRLYAFELATGKELEGLVPSVQYAVAPAFYRGPSRSYLYTSLAGLVDRERGLLLEGEVDRASVSPDGKLAAVGVASDGGWQIELVELAGPPFARRPFRRGRMPAFSPDGSRIAFVERALGFDHIFVAPLAHPDAAVQVTSDPNDHDAPSWSPDGRWLALDWSGFVDPTASHARETTRNIAIIRASGGELSALTDGNQMQRQPAWAPTGIYFSGHINDKVTALIYRLTLADGALGDARR